MRIVLLGFADILNQQFKNYSSLSQTRSEVKMVQSLVPIWEVYFSHIHFLLFKSLLTFYIVQSFDEFLLGVLARGMKELECMR